MRRSGGAAFLESLSQIPGGPVLRAVLENPIAVREWRILRRRALDWRIWLGLKWTLDPLVWGAPVVITYAVAPYALWLVLGCLRGLKLIPAERLPVDPFLMLVWIFGFYVVGMTEVLGATAVTHEREQQTWEQVWLTSLSGGERAAGYYWGRLGPLLAGAAATTTLWWLLRPHYAALLRPFWPAVMSRSQLAMAAGITLALSLASGLIGLLASAISRHTLTAVVCASMGCWYAVSLLFSFTPLIVAATLSMSGGRPDSAGVVAVALIALAIAVFFVWALWLGTASALTRHPVPAHIIRTGDRDGRRTTYSAGTPEHVE